MFGVLEAVCVPGSVVCCCCVLGGGGGLCIVSASGPLL